MAEKAVMVRNPSGLHARPASDFLGCAKQYASKVWVGRVGEELVDAKSIVMILSSGFQQGDQIVIRAEGEDAQAAVEALVDMVEGGFGEC